MNDFSSSDFQNKVRDFHKHMNHPIDVKVDAEQLLFRARLITEEAAEFVKAASQKDHSEMVDALCDLLYVTFGTGVVMGVDLAPAFEKVHHKNMQKIPASSPTEKPSKPKDWTPPSHD